jgi:hypothetical protein
VENALKRLGTDWIDLYQVHRPDPETDVEETLSPLTEPVQQGKIRYIGSSSYSVVGGHQEPPFGPHCDPASSVESGDQPVVFGVREHRLDHLDPFAVELFAVI